MIPNGCGWLSGATGTRAGLGRALVRVLDDRGGDADRIGDEARGQTLAGVLHDPG